MINRVFIDQFSTPPSNLPKDSHENSTNEFRSSSQYLRIEFTSQLVSTSAELGGLLMVLFSGLSAGGMWIIVVDRLPVWKRMAVVDYATDFRRSLLHVDPMMPIFVVLSGAGALLLALNTTGAVRNLGWSVLACQLVIVTLSVLFAEPVNSKFRRLPEGTPPEKTEHYRVFWRRFHSTRTAVSLSAFLMSILALVSV